MHSGLAHASSTVSERRRCEGMATRSSAERGCEALRGREGKRVSGHRSISARASSSSAKSGSNAKDDEEVKRLREKAREQIESHYKSSPSSTHASSPTTLDATSEQAELRQKLLSAFAYLGDGLVERETEIRLMMLAALSGEHLLLLGPPGTAKSELGRRLSDMCSGNFFERLLTRFSVPEELFGPLSMRSLEADRYERHIDGYLPTANVAFVDEVFKANSAILNALLTILQERLFDNGSRRISVPLVCLIGASNELPESEELDALYDRFLIRYQVEQVSQQNLQALITGSNGSSIDSTSDDDERAASQESAVGQRSGNASPLSIEDMQGVAQSAQKHVRMPDNVGQLIAGLREHLQEQCEPPVYVSDRRLVKAVSMLKVAAYTDGRTRVSEFDCLLLRHVLWQRPEEREYVSNYLLDRTVELKGAQQLRYFLGQTYSRACRVLSGVQSDEQVDKLVEDTQNLCNALSVQVAELSDSESGGLSALEQHLWLGPTDAARMSQQISPRLKKARQDVVGLLDDAVTLKVALEDGSPTYILALLLPHFWRAHVIDVRTFCFKAIGSVHFRPKSSTALAGVRVRRGVSATRRAELGARHEHTACVCSQRRIQQHEHYSQHSLWFLRAENGEGGESERGREAEGELPRTGDSAVDWSRVVCPVGSESAAAEAPSQSAVDAPAGTKQKRRRQSRQRQDL